VLSFGPDFFPPRELPFQAMRCADAIKMSDTDQHPEVGVQLILSVERSLADLSPRYI